MLEINNIVTGYGDMKVLDGITLSVAEGETVALVGSNGAGKTTTMRLLTGILDPYQLRFSPDMKWFVTAANRLNHIDIYRWDGQTPTLAKRIARWVGVRLSRSREGDRHRER